MLRLIIPLALMSVVACAAASEPMPAAPPTAAGEAAPAALVQPPAPAPAAPAELIPAEASSSVSCDIYRARTLRGLRLEARAMGFEDVPGVLDYEFIVTKTDSNGSSDIVQAGEVSETMLGSVDLNVERGARFRARLTLRDRDGEVCAAEFRS